MSTPLFDPPESIPAPTTSNAARHAAKLTRRGNHFHAQRDYTQAEELYRQAIQINPRHTYAHYQLALINPQQKRYAQAIKYFRLTLSCNPDHPQAAASLALLAMHTCDWQLVDQTHQHLKSLDQDLSRHQLPPLHPYINFFLSKDPEEQIETANKWSAILEENMRPLKKKLSQIPKHQHPTLHVGYMSSRFNHTPIGQSLLQLITLQSRAGLKVSCFYHGPNSGSRLLTRYQRTAHKFNHMYQKGPDTYASAVKSAGIDVLVDLDGLLPSQRLDVLSLRPAPVQVTWLGIPSTTGAAFIDYLISDPVVCPKSMRAKIAEKLILIKAGSILPFPQVPPTTHRSKKADFGIPKQSFIFTSFASPRYLSQETVHVWVRILTQTPQSVLWLLEDNRAAAKNLRRYAKSQGIDPERLIFTPPLPLIPHLEKLRLADLVLDTFPISYFQDTIPALYTGTPVLTRTGNALAARTTASILTAAGLTDLITGSAKQYQRLATSLAADPDRHTELTQKVKDLDPDLPIYNAAQFSHSLTKLFKKIHRRHRSGKQPRGFTI